MKRALIIIFSFIIATFAVFGASYKVNKSGKVVSPSGKVQTKSTVLTPQNIYSNYQARNYVANQQVLVSQTGIIDIVMDFSGSMYNWVQVSKYSMKSIVAQLPASTKIGLRVFGHDNGLNPYDSNISLSKVKKIVKSEKGKYKVTTTQDKFLGNTRGGCSATSQIVPVMTSNSVALINGMQKVNLGGSTPLTLALKMAVDTDLRSIPTSISKKIVLITDGDENCGGDPCAFAKDLVKKRSDITIDVVLVSSSSKALKCVADITGGKMYTTSNVDSFADIMTTTLKDAPQNTQTAPAQQYEYVPY